MSGALSAPSAPPSHATGVAPPPEVPGGIEAVVAALRDAVGAASVGLSARAAAITADLLTIQGLVAHVDEQSTAELREVEASVQRFDALHRRFNAQVHSTINAPWQPPSA